MALKAGYYGVKKSILSTLLSLAALGIKSIGEGLSLDANGVLSATASGGGAIDYSTTEQNTNTKWLDDRDIYSKTYVFETPASITDGAWFDTGLIDTSIDYIIDSIVRGSDTNVKYQNGYRGTSCVMINPSDGQIGVFSRTGGDIKSITVYYVKKNSTKTTKKK